MKYTDAYNEQKHKVYSYFYYNLGGDVGLAEDLTSDTFLKGFEKFDTYDDTYQFSTWIFTIARNTLYNYYKKQKVQVSLDDSTELSLEEFTAYEEIFGNTVDREIAMNQVYEHIQSIPEGQKDMIVMKYIQDFSTREISQMTGKSEASIRKSISRGLQHLEKSMRSLAY